MKKTLFAGFAALALVTVPVAAVLAETSSSSSTTPVVASGARKNVVEIGPAGRALLRGTLKSKATSTIVVTSWGGDWTVRLSSDTKIQPKVTDTSLASFEVGDFVGVNGVVATGQAWTIDASLIRNWTERREAQMNHKEIEKQKKEDRKDGIGRNFDGSVTAVASSTISMNVGTEPHTVNYGSGTLFVNRNFAKITSNDVRTGDKLVVWGTRASSTITATIVRDLSIPR